MKNRINKSPFAGVAFIVIFFFNGVNAFATCTPLWNGPGPGCYCTPAGTHQFFLNVLYADCTLAACTAAFGDCTGNAAPTATNVVL